MANSKYSYVKDFETKDQLKSGRFIVLRLNCSNFARFCEVNEFIKPNDEKAQNLMNSCAISMCKEWSDIVLAYGFGHEYSFILRKETDLFKRRLSGSKMTILLMGWASGGKIAILLTTRVALIDLNDGVPCMLFPGDENNLINTCLWKLVESGKSEQDAQEILEESEKSKGKLGKNEILFQRFGINYNDFPDMFRQGSCILKTEVDNKRKIIIVHTENIASTTFLNGYSILSKELTDLEENVSSIGEEQLNLWRGENHMNQESKDLVEKNMKQESQDHWIVIRIDGCHFSRLTKVHRFKKPFEEQALKLMDSCAMAVFEEFKDIVYGYGQSDEYNFLLENNTQLYQRFDSKLVSAICSVFTDAYVKKWKEFLPQKELQYAPRFDGRAVCYKSYKLIRDYLSWRQSDCHINSKHNTLFWARVNSGESKKRAQINLQGVLRKEWYTILSQEFGIEYNQLPPIFRNGTSVFWDEKRRYLLQTTNDFVCWVMAVISLIFKPFFCGRYSVTQWFQAAWRKASVMGKAAHHEKYKFKIAPDHKASWVIDQQPSVSNACGTPLLVFKLPVSVSHICRHAETCLSTIKPTAFHISQPPYLLWLPDSSTVLSTPHPLLQTLDLQIKAYEEYRPAAEKDGEQKECYIQYNHRRQQRSRVFVENNRVEFWRKFVVGSFALNTRKICFVSLYGLFSPLGVVVFVPVKLISRSNKGRVTDMTRLGTQFLFLPPLDSFSATAPDCWPPPPPPKQAATQPQPPVPNPRPVMGSDPNTILAISTSSSLAKKKTLNPKNLINPMEPSQPPQEPNKRRPSKKDLDTPDPLAANYGDIPTTELMSLTVPDLSRWKTVKSLGKEMEGETVLVRGRLHVTRPVSKKMAFLMVREDGFTVQCVVNVAEGLVSAQMVKFAVGITKESFVDVEGVVSVLEFPFIRASQQEVEIQVTKIYCVNRAASGLPISVDDAARSEAEIESALELGEQLVRVNQDTRLDHRVVEIRTLPNHGIFFLKSNVLRLFRQFMWKYGFHEICTPKILAGASEGGAAVFRLEYKNRPACLAQSPQFHKQMAICGDFQRVFVVGPVFRAEDSHTPRHLCEFTGLDVEMEIKGHYSEVMDIVDSLFVDMFDKINEECQQDLEAIMKQYPFKPLKYLKKTLRLTFEQGIQLLKDAGIEVDPLGDLNTETERALGKLVLEKYDTEFYILHRYPLAVRPFYTMPCPDNNAYSNSFDVFIRGEEIISGAQRVHMPELLESRARECGIDVKTISTYIDSFRYGAPPHGGFGVGLERVVMLFCALDNIRRASLFPRDTRRLEP
ncbi:class II aminoacyl-tRNA and biotin synthetases superfamily protein [Artemisia annua]|uniref:aspartate--tRNA ligase n=1 Tax=Artemisia annua TaxID=35608 RepID=A0A2U1PW06_ARTAN|nr:class II aminoacyl-tRNA and biotin synthetases superfamily protein [Artemisia annua]